jgi:preprotein translocase subunit SecE
MASDRHNDPASPSDPRPEDNVPGELEHASGEVDEFEAAVAAGAAGNDRPGDATAEVAAGANGDADDSDGDDVDAELERRMAEPVGDLDDDGDIDEDDRALARTGGRETAHPPKGGPRFLQFLRASWAELQRVQWPDRRQVAQATSVVIGFVIVAGAYLGVADWAAQKVVNFII